MRRSPTLAAGLTAAAAAALLAAAPNAFAQPTMAPTRASGQTVTPAFEGWYKNADGTFSLSFGYFNRNAKETLDVPVGANNFFTPGPADRGQPAHFEPRRHWGVFAVVVPKALALGEKVTWTLIVRGDTMRIPGHMRANWQIDALEGEAGSNRPPLVRFAADGPEGSGPGGIAGPGTTAKVGAPLELKVWVSDDGRTRGSVAGSGRGSAPQLRWFKHSGPGEVTFANAAPRPTGDAGLATTTATFSAPGDYVLRVRANDGSVASAGHSQCCWSNGFVRVQVVP